jgi:DNA polymerase sigma
MDFIKLESVFTEYILDLIGPNEDLDKKRKENFEFIEQIIKDGISKEYPDIEPHVFLFGSYPLKSYLQESDLDVTIIFQDKKNKDFYLNNSFDFLNK